MSAWTCAIIAYSVLISATFVPVILTALRKSPTEVPRKYETIDYFTEAERHRLQANLDDLFAEIAGWENKYNSYITFQFYSLGWTILASVLVPILAQAIDETPQSKWFLTLVSLHASVLLAFNKGLSVDDKVELYRDARHDLRDLDRSLRVSPRELGSTSVEAEKNYVKQLEDIVTTVRLGEAKKVVLPDPSTVHVPAGAKR